MSKIIWKDSAFRPPNHERDCVCVLCQSAGQRCGEDAPRITRLPVVCTRAIGHPGDHQAGGAIRWEGR